MHITLKHILCPTDFSECAQHALNYATAFAELYGAELHLLHVMETPVYSSMDYPISPEISESINEVRREKLEQTLEEVRRRHLEVRGRIIEGAPFYEIISYAKECGIDLIVIGTHGRTGLAHMLIGSVAEKVVRKSPCPVLTVKHPEHEFIMP